MPFELHRYEVSRISDGIQKTIDAPDTMLAFSWMIVAYIIPAIFMDIM